YPPISTLFPYTTLFRSVEGVLDEGCDVADEVGERRRGARRVVPDGQRDERDGDDCDGLLEVHGVAAASRRCPSFRSPRKQIGNVILPMWFGVFQRCQGRCHGERADG